MTNTVYFVYHIGTHEYSINNYNYAVIILKTLRVTFGVISLCVDE